MPLILMSVVNCHFMLLKQLIKNFYLALIIDDSNYADVVVCIVFFSLQPGFGWFFVWIFFYSAYSEYSIIMMSIFFHLAI